jgi:ABC-2 type transport system ATP-binding protein
METGGSFFLIMKILSCDNIYKSYKTNLSWSKNKIALQGVSFHVNQYEVFGIIGPNGAGKSTILKILMGFVRQDNGHAKVANHPPGSVESHLHLGYLPENPSLYPHLSIEEHLQFACRVGHMNRQESRIAIQKVLQTVDLTAVAKTPIKKFSKGMTQRAALAYALVSEPKILILDEPMSGLDPLGRQMVIDIIQEYQNKKTTILFCSHILNDVERICDRIAIMNHGQLVTTTTPDILQTNYPKSDKNNGKTPLESYFLDVIQGVH